MGTIGRVVKDNLAKIGFIATWRYLLKEDIVIEINNDSITDFYSEYFDVVDNFIYIRKGYAWNGCNPSYCYTLPFVSKTIWIGTPDGKIDPITQLPQTWKASLVHDCFCQYRDRLSGVSKAFTVELFYRLLLESGFSQFRCKFYSTAVNWFGPQTWK